MFVNILTADDKFFLLSRDNLRQPIHMLLSQKQKLFPEIVSAFLKSTLNFEDFRKNDDPYSWSISEITDSEKRGEINV